ncbi:MAG: glycoside hydrolase family 15 protein [Lentisphaerota bacterium]
MKKHHLLLLFFASTFSSFSMPSDMPCFSNEVMWHIKANLEENIASDSNRFPEALYPEKAARKEALLGAIVAAPYEKKIEEKQTNNDKFTYLWQRDGGIAMLAIEDELKSAVATDDKESITRYAQMMINYIKFFDYASRQDGYYPGIAKFYLSGESVTDWQNPQNDGPAFTALVFTEFANLIMSQKEPLNINGTILDKNFVEKYLFDIKGNGLINQNLSYIVDNSREECFDLWESCLGQMFFTKMVQIKALTAGAALSTNFNNLSLASKYIAAAEDLSYQAVEHYQTFTYGQEKFKSYCEGSDIPLNLSFPIYPKYKSNNFSKYRGMSLDSSVILGILFGNLYEYSQPDSWVYKSLTKDKIIAKKFVSVIQESKEDLSPTSLEVIKTVRLIADKSFSKKGLDSYKINEDLPKGINLIGRYPGDIYNGITWNDPLNKGNPWFITSIALAQYYYTLAYELKKPDYIEMGNKQMELVFKYIDGKENASGKSFRMSEQIDRNTGEQTSANDYTWSYAQYLLVHHAFVQARRM